VGWPRLSLTRGAEEGPTPRAEPLPGGSSAPIVRVVPQQAGVAQSVEQLICNQQVKGSSPLASSENRDVERRESRAGQGSDRVRHAIGSGRAIRGQGISAIPRSWGTSWRRWAPGGRGCLHFFQSNKPIAGDEAPSVSWQGCGEVPKRPNGADCKSAGFRLRRFESSPLHHGFDRVKTHGRSTRERE
jgi:hypothetical protein